MARGCGAGTLHRSSCSSADVAFAEHIVTGTGHSSVSDFRQNLLTKPLYHIWLCPAALDYISEVLLVLADTTLKLKALKHVILNTVQQVSFALRTPLPLL